MVSCLLTLSTAFVAYRSGEQLSKTLSDQISERIGSTNDRNLQNFTTQLGQWKALSGAVIQNLANLDGATFNSLVESVVKSNKGIVSLRVVVLEEGSSKPPRTIAQYDTPYLDQPELVASNPKSLFLEIRKRESAHLSDFSSKKKDSPSTQEIMSFGGSKSANLSTVINSISSGSKKILAYLTVQSSLLQGSLDLSKGSRSFLFGENREPILWSPNLSKSDALAFRSQPEVKEALEGGLINGKTQSGSGNSNLTAFSKTENGKYALFAEFNVSDEKDVLKKRLQQLAVLTLAFLWIALGILYLVTGQVMGRLWAAVGSTKSIASGNFSFRLPASGKDEIGVLSRSVNEMAVKIEALLHKMVFAARRELELATAHKFQSTFFPKSRSLNSCLSVEGKSWSATECAGDWWTFYDLSESQILVVVADATGHGTSAALMGATTFGYFESRFRTEKVSLEPIGLDLAELATNYNSILWGSSQGGITMTMLLMLFDTVRMEVRVVNCGHVPPVFVLDTVYQGPANDDPNEKATKASESLLVSGNGLGMFADTTFEEGLFPLRLDGSYVAFTDGLIENKNSTGKALKGRGLRKEFEKCASQQDFKKSLFAKISEFFGEAEIEDDLTLVVVRPRNNSLEGVE